MKTTTQVPDFSIGYYYLHGSLGYSTISRLGTQFVGHIIPFSAPAKGLKGFQISTQLDKYLDKLGKI